jgi:ribosomal protection tetracycline resistance protein
LRTINLGILAHVDAGKTSLTERLLFAAGVIDTIGSVDRGDTQTDTLALERQRGITIKSAVASFALGDLGVSLIDTPGHPDFIAEVERVLAVLDGAVLVISAVEGVQAQTRILVRALRRLGIPTLIFVNKIDRAGADSARVLRQIADRLTPQVVAMGAVRAEGSRVAALASYGCADPAFAGALAEQLADRSDAVLAAVVEGRPLPYDRLRAELAAQVRSAAIYPVFLGSAITGAGIAELIAGFGDLLLPGAGDPDGPLSAMVFKVERGPAGEKIAFTRVFSGTITVRDRVPFGAEGNGEARVGKVTGISVFGAAGDTPASSVQAGQIARIRGLAQIRTGDVIGVRPPGAAEHHFARPALEAVVIPDRPADRARMHTALQLLAEQDPLINLRQDEVRDEALLSLYGEVQKEIVQQTLAADFGIAVRFSETTTLHIERPVGSGAAVERMSEEGNPFKATIGLRVDPGPAGSGVAFGLEIEPGSLPRAFTQAVAATARESLRQGLHGWEVTDCVITLTRSGYVPPPPTGWSKYSSSAADFRNLTPLVLMAALRRARTAVLEPVHAFRIEAPADTLRLMLPALARLGAVPRGQSLAGPDCVIEGTIAAAAIRDLQLQLPPLTGGEGILESRFAHYAPVTGAIPVRRRSGPDPLNRREYLLHASGRAQECFANRQ